MAEFLAAMAGIALDAWRSIKAGKEAEQVKRDARDRADVAIDNAFAKRRLAARGSHV